LAEVEALVAVLAVEVLAAVALVEAGKTNFFLRK
jgi:hypothetical protein